jgi:hypothetical protein
MPGTLSYALRETSISPMWQRDTKTVSLLMWPYSVCHSAMTRMKGIRKAAKEDEDREPAVIREPDED